MTTQWKMLPMKLHRDMEAAGAEAAREYMERTGGNSLWAIYEAMVAAAPQPPALGGEVEVLGYRIERGTSNHFRDTPAHGRGTRCIALVDQAHVGLLQAEVELLRYKSDLYDEVWGQATDMGFMNVTTAIDLLKRETNHLKELLRDVLPGMGDALGRRAIRKRITAVLKAPNSGQA